MSTKRIKPKSTLDCDHLAMRLISGAIGDLDNYHVFVCPQCGQFEVSGHVDGKRFNVKFTISTEDTLRAAGQWLRHLEAENS